MSNSADILVKGAALQTVLYFAYKSLNFPISQCPFHFPCSSTFDSLSTLIILALLNIDCSSYSFDVHLLAGRVPSALLSLASPEFDNKRGMHSGTQLANSFSSQSFLLLRPRCFRDVFVGTTSGAWLGMLATFILRYGPRGHSFLRNGWLG